MQIKVADLRPNPFRDLSHYPLNSEKIEALKRSIRDTSFWDNLLARKAPDGDGYQIAYGHHRYQALKELKISEIDVPVRDLSNTTMAQIMAHENMEEWSHSASIEQETVRAIVEAYGRGDIELPKVNGSANKWRHAPSFTAIVSDRPQQDSGPSSSKDHPYTIETLTKFLGWKPYKVESALDGLVLIERGLAKTKDFAGLSPKQAQVVAQQGRRILNDTKDEKKAAAVIRGLADGMRNSVGLPSRTGKIIKKQAVTIHNAKFHADVMAGNQFKNKIQGKPKNQRDINKFTVDLTLNLNNFPTEMQNEHIEAIFANLEYLAEDTRNDLFAAIRGVAQRWAKLGDRPEVKRYEH